MSSDTSAAERRYIRLADYTAIDLSAFLGRRLKKLPGSIPLLASLKGATGTNEILVGTSVRPPQHEPVRQGEISEISQ